MVSQAVRNKATKPKVSPLALQARVYDLAGEPWTLQPGTLLHREVATDQQEGHIETFLPTSVIREQFRNQSVTADTTEYEPYAGSQVAVDFTWRTGAYLRLRERVKRRGN